MMHNASAHTVLTVALPVCSEYKVPIGMQHVYGERLLSVLLCSVFLQAGLIVVRLKSLHVTKPFGAHDRH